MAYATAEENYSVELEELELSRGEVMEHEPITRCIRLLAQATIL
jgi:hypothetical protein